jgi:acyl carrier protein
MEEIRKQVEDVFREVFDDADLSLRNEMTADDIDGWDSLRHIDIIIAIEKRLDVKFATAEISRLRDEGSNIGTLLELVARKQNQIQ